MAINDEKDLTVKAKRWDADGEVILYCESSGRALKEGAMMARFQVRFEDGLQAIANSLGKKRGHKRYGKVMERIGRLRERYPSIDRFYDVQVQEEEG